jgi:hypothetical protein
MKLSPWSRTAEWSARDRGLVGAAFLAVHADKHRKEKCSE